MVSQKSAENLCFRMVVAEKEVDFGVVLTGWNLVLEMVLTCKEHEQI